MLAVFTPRGASLARAEQSFDAAPGEDTPGLPADAVWFDLVAPSLQEDKAVERLLGVDVPTREEMQEIEPSSRLYAEAGARYMTATLLCQSDTTTPKTTPVTFILAGDRLVTVRYDDPRPFAVIGAKLARACPANITGTVVLIDLFDAIIDRAADVLERISADVDQLSQSVFEKNKRTSQEVQYQAVLRTIGRKGDLLSKAREALVSIGRVLLFLQNEAEGLNLSKDQRAQLKSMSRDVSSLADHASYLGDKVIFLLDATLGLVSIEQNKVIKIFAVLSVVLMPPTLIASIYGMNFKYMPELDWHFGYPLAIGAMLLAAIVPYLVFRWMKWL